MEKKGVERKSTSIKINPKIWKEFKIYCLKKDIDMSNKMEELISKEIKKK